MSMAKSFTLASLAAALVAAAAGVAGCLSIEERMRRTEEGGAFSEGLQGVLMVSQTEVSRGRPVVLNFAIKNGGTQSARIAKKISRDSGWAGLVMIFGLFGGSESHGRAKEVAGAAILGLILVVLAPSIVNWIVNGIG